MTRTERIIYSHMTATNFLVEKNTSEFPVLPDELLCFSNLSLKTCTITHVQPNLYCYLYLQKPLQCCNLHELEYNKTS